MRFSMLPDLLDLPLGEEAGEQLQTLRKPSDAHAQIVDLVRAGFLGRAMYLKRQRGEQAVHLLDGVIVHAALAWSRLSPRQLELRLISFPERIGHAFRRPNFQVGVRIGIER